MKALVLLVTLSLAYGDHLDDIKQLMDAVDETNCHHKSSTDLQLPHSVVTHIPVYGDGAREMFANRSLTMEAYKMTLNRGFFFSIIYQKLNMSRDFAKQPDLVYTYLSAMSDVTSGPDDIVGSGIYYDKNTSYPNFYRTLYFNHTVPLLGAYANRMQGGIRVEDDSIRNYTRLATGSSANIWYSLWLPDGTRYVRPKDVYGISHNGDNGLTSTFYFYGPNYQVYRGNVYDKTMAVKFTDPYFDCGRTNKWVVSVASPVTDSLPRYIPWQHLRKPLFVAESTVEIDFTKFDINPCPYSYGNPTPNYFAGIAACKDTTECQPLSGFGLSRGGYECACRPGYRYKNHTQTEPFRGVDIEMATMEEYINGFECEEIEGGDQPVLTDNAVQQRQRVLNITADNCRSRSPSDLVLPYNEQLLKHFKPQGRVAVRLAHFLSSFLQTQFNPGQDSELKPQQSLNKDQLFAEVASNVLGDIQIVASDAYIMLSTEEIVSVYVTKKISPSDNHPNDHVVKSSSMTNMTESVFSDEQNVWKTAVSGLRTINAKPWMKIIPTAQILTQMGTWTYKVPDYEQGKWGVPTFVCDSRVMEWTLKYTIPVFGPGETGSSVKFRGAVSVSVSVPMSLLSDV